MEATAPVDQVDFQEDMETKEDLVVVLAHPMVPLRLDPKVDTAEEDLDNLVD